MGTLFGNVPRTDATPGRHAETTFQFLDRSAWPKSAAVRDLLEDWFCRYPRSHQADLRTRFVDDFHAAFFELFLHAYLSVLGYGLEPHPAVPNSTRRPDFLVTKDTCRFYLEATVARDISDDEASKRRVKNLLLDAINDISSRNFFLALKEFTVVPGKQPSAKKIKAFLERELAALDPDSIKLNELERPLRDGPGLSYEDDSIRLSIGLIPRSPNARGRTDIRPIGVYPIASRWGGSDILIRDALNAKATRYGQLALPYLIAVNCISEWGVDDGDILNALFGTEQLTFVKGSKDPIPSRKRDGAFIGPNGPWNTRVSAALVCHIFPWSLRECRLELYHNPWAARPLQSCELALRSAVVVDGNVEWTGDNQLLAHFALPSGWPEVGAA